MKPCSWPFCRREVEDWRWGCGEHWRLLPVDIRQRIDLRMQDALHDAQAWIRATFSDISEKPRKSWETVVRFVRDRDEARARRRAATMEEGDGDG